MTLCPDCGHENIPGADACESCQQPLRGLSKPVAVSPIARRIAKDRIELFQPRTPLTVAPSATLAEVFKLLQTNDVGCVMVVEEGKIVGIFSERDALMRLGADAEKLVDRPVSEYMTPEPRTLKATDKIAFALHRMDVGGFRHIPIVDGDGRPTGIISIRDILRYISGLLAEAEQSA